MTSAMKRVVQELFETKLSDFLKNAGEGTTRRRLIELIGSCSHFLREINPSMQSVSINQVKTQTEVSEAETKQAFV